MTPQDSTLCAKGIDELQQLAQKFRTSEEFKKMLKFVARFHYLAPYNAYLVQLQRPGASLVLNIRRWRQYGWRPTINAQNLITLIPFGPIECMYEVSDVEKIPDMTHTPTDDILKDLQRGLNVAKGEVNPKEWFNLLFNLTQYGIRIDLNFNASNAYGGYIMCDDGDHDLLVAIDSQEGWLSYKSAFFISVNRDQNQASQFHTICHELGHLFCHHLSYSHWRAPTLDQEEFEAETVAWLVCKRHGVDNPSEQYLASYIRNGLVPLCSVDSIMRAVTEIEKMLKRPLMARQTLRYKEDEEFKQAVDERTHQLQLKRKSHGAR